VKLLRVLESGTVTRVGATESVAVDTRIIAASNRNLADTVAEGEFREDLLYRLNVFPIELPPLRQRAGDVALLAEHFLAVLNARDGDAKRLTPRALRRLEQQPWPGNVRELKNLVERLWILADTEIDQDAIPSAVGASPAPSDDTVLEVRVGTALDEVERRMILATLDSLDGNKKRAAKQLGISLKTLYNRLAVYGASAGQGEKTR
jgi:DNA-binding NtrC family response regulator